MTNRLDAFTQMVPAVGSAVISVSGGIVTSKDARGNLISTGTDAGAVINATFAAVDAGSTIYILTGTYTFTTAISFTKNIAIQGDPRGTVFNFDGNSLATLMAMSDTTTRKIDISDLSITNTNASPLGTAINCNYFTVSVIRNVWITNVKIGLDFNVTGTFYNMVIGVRISVGAASGYGIRFANGANNNTVLRTRILGSDSNNATGILVDAVSTGLYSVNCESGANVLLVGIEVGANGDDCAIIDPYLEANATNILINSGTRRLCLQGGHILSGSSADLTDNSVIGENNIDTSIATATFTTKYKLLGKSILTGSADVMTVSGFNAQRELMIIAFTIATGGNTNALLTFNNDTGANYAIRSSTNGGADATSVSQANILLRGAGAAGDCYIVAFVKNLLTNEKLVTAQSNINATAGAANAPSRIETVGKWANTAAGITRVDLTNSTTGDFAAGSYLYVFGVS